MIQFDEMDGENPHHPIHLVLFQKWLFMPVIEVTLVQLTSLKIGEYPFIHSQGSGFHINLFGNVYLFTPKNWWNDPIWRAVFQMGWKKNTT